jgi:hypothetical protein
MKLPQRSAFTQIKQAYPQQRESVAEQQHPEKPYHNNVGAHNGSGSTSRDVAQRLRVGIVGSYPQHNEGCLFEEE